MIFVPVDPESGVDYKWVERVVENVARVPKTTKWDTPDSVSMALRYLRLTGLLVRREEHGRQVADELSFRVREPALY